MRGLVRTLCAAGAIAILASARLAASAASPVPLTLATDPAPRPAAAYFDGTAFGASAGPITASGYTVAPQNFASPYGPPRARATDLRDFAARVSLSPVLALDLGYGLDDTGRFTRDDFGAQAFDGLFLSASALTSAYAPIGSYASYVGGSLNVANNVRVHVGTASYTPDRNGFAFQTFDTIGQPVGAFLDYSARTASSIMAGVSFDVARWGGFDATVARTNERPGLLGADIDSTALNLSAHVKFGDGWVTTASYGQALSKLDVKSPAITITPSDDALHRPSYALAIAKHGVFGDDSLGLSVSQPLPTDQGTNTFATIDNAQTAPVFVGRDHLLDNLKPETDIEVGYVTTFLDGSVALQTNAAYQMNFAGQNGTNSVSLLSRAKIKF
jgi:hypothetical protein